MLQANFLRVLDWLVPLDVHTDAATLGRARIFGANGKTGPTAPAEKSGIRRAT
jgi:hypothetical protein